MGQGLESIRPDAQERVANILAEPVTSRASMGKKLDAIMAEMIRGAIPPPVFMMLKQMLELQANNIYVMHEEQGTTHLVASELKLSVTRLLENARQPNMYLMSAGEARREALPLNDPDLIDAEEQDAEPE